jgi:hypothetical protein
MYGGKDRPLATSHRLGKEIYLSTLRSQGQPTWLLEITHAALVTQGPQWRVGVQGEAIAEI